VGVTAYCYAEVSVSSIVVAKSIATTHCASSQRDGQAELACVAGLKLMTVYPQNRHYHSTNWAQCTACPQLLEMLEVSWNLIGPPGNY